MGDTVILITYAQIGTERAREFESTMMHVGADNRILRLGNDPAPTPTACGVDWLAARLRAGEGQDFTMRWMAFIASSIFSSAT